MVITFVSCEKTIVKINFIHSNDRLYGNAALDCDVTVVQYDIIMVAS